MITTCRRPDWSSLNQSPPALGTRRSVCPLRFNSTVDFHYDLI